MRQTCGRRRRPSQRWRGGPRDSEACEAAQAAHTARGTCHARQAFGSPAPPSTPARRRLMATACLTQCLLTHGLLTHSLLTHSLLTHSLLTHSLPRRE